MEGMNLAKLEAVVEKMLHNLQEMKRENASLQAQLEAKQNKIEELEARVEGMASNQEEVSNRVTNLLSSIEEWEKSVEPEEAAEAEETVVPEEAAGLEDVPESPEEFVEPKGGGLFSLGE